MPQKPEPKEELLILEKKQLLLEQQLLESLSKKMGVQITEDFLATIPILKTEYAEALDEVYGKTDDLIKPSHSLCKYSILEKKPELEQYIPNRTGNVLMDILQSESVCRATEIIQEHTSENTKRAYAGDLIYWQAWLSGMGFSFCTPITEKEITTFIIQHAEGLEPSVDQKLVDQGYKYQLGPHKLSTIKRRLAILSVFLDNAKWPNHCQNKEIKLLLHKLTKKYGTSKPDGKAITRDILDDMLDTCGKKLIDIRDRALLLFAWGSGGRRRAEVTSAEYKNLLSSSDEDFIYTLPESKTDQVGKGQTVPIKGRAAQALQKWLYVSGIKEGCIFRSISKGGEIRDGLSPIDVHRIVRRRVKAAGYDEKSFGAHSLRSGFVTEGGRRGKPLGDIMAMTGHKSVNTAMRYYQVGSIINNSAANLAG